MTIHVGWLVVGIGLLLFPADRLLSSLVRLRTFDCFGDDKATGRQRPWWWVPALWVDPIRGFAGAYLLNSALVSPTYWAAIEKGPYAIVVAVLCLAVVVQMFTRLERDTFLAPLGFVSGIVAAFAPWTVTLITVTMGLTGMFAFRRFHAFFSSAFAAVAFLGFVLGAGPAWLIPALAVLGLPWILAALTHRSLEVPTRNNRVARSAPR